jgi:hypothetical protein
MIMRAMVPPEVSCGEPGARAVRRPTERSGHVVTRNLAARIVEYEVTTSRDQEAYPKSLHGVTSGLLHVVASHYMEWPVTTWSGLSLDVVTTFEAYIAFGAFPEALPWEEIR